MVVRENGLTLRAWCWNWLFLPTAGTFVFRI